jgi:hypothetical protein
LSEEIDKLEKENTEIREKILKMNKDLSEDLTDFSLQENIEWSLEDFIKSHESAVREEFMQVRDVKGMLKGFDKIEGE